MEDTPPHHSSRRPQMGDFMRRLVLRENTTITLLILAVVMLDVVAVLILVK